MVVFTVVLTKASVIGEPCETRVRKIIHQIVLTSGPKSEQS